MDDCWGGVEVASLTQSGDRSPFHWHLSPQQLRLNGPSLPWPAGRGRATGSGQHGSGTVHELPESDSPLRR